MESCFRPDLYAKNNSFQTLDAKFVIEKYRHLLAQDANGHFMDLGCGDASITATVIAPALNWNFKELVGADISPGMIQHAKKYHERDNIKFRVLDILTESLPHDLEGLFDQIFSFHCLHWASHTREDLCSAMCNIRKLLKKNGSIFTVFVNEHPYFRNWHSLLANPKYQPFAKSADYVFPCYVDYENKEEWWMKVFKDTGFRVKIFESFERTHNFGSIQKAFDAISAINAIVVPQELRDEMKADLLAEVKKRIKENGVDGKPACSINYTYFFVYAEKE